MNISIESIKRETEKAVLIACEIENAAGRKGAEFWFPRSQVKIEGNTLVCPDWLAQAKLADRYNENIARATWFN